MKLLIFIIFSFSSFCVISESVEIKCNTHTKSLKEGKNLNCQSKFSVLPYNATVNSVHVSARYRCLHKRRSSVKITNAIYIPTKRNNQQSRTVTVSVTRACTKNNHTLIYWQEYTWGKNTMVVREINEAINNFYHNASKQIKMAANMQNIAQNWDAKKAAMTVVYTINYTCPLTPTMCPRGGRK